MSLPKKTTVKCSKCGAEIETTVFESVNTDYSSDIAEQIISGELFNAECHKCGFVSHLEYDILYHDVKRGAMIWVLHDNSSEYATQVAEMRSSPNILDYKTTRIVHNMNELRQKVACLENNRDDRIIELCKAFISYSLLSKQPDFELNNVFYTTFLGKERVFLYDIKGEELSCELTEDAYSMLCDMYYNSEYASKFQDYYAIVDHDWAEGVLQPLLKQESERIDAKNAANDAPAGSTNTAEKKVVCPKCKQTLPEDSAFCHYCGTAIGKAPNPNAPIVDVVDFPSANENKKYTSSDNPKKKKAKKKAIIITIISILAVALIAGIIGIVISMNGNSDDGRPDTVYNVAVRTISLGDEFTAEIVLATWKNGEATEQSMIQIMNEYGSEKGGGQLYVITRGEFVDEIDEWCFSDKRKVGDCAIIKNAYGYSICYISGFNIEDNNEANNGTTTPSYKELGVTLAQYNIATMIADNPDTYCKYIAELDEIISKATYSEDLKKEKASEYINDWPLDYGLRIIMFRIQFPSDTTYCNDIVDYLNERDDISYDEMVFILEELGFAVFADGTVKW